MKSDGVEIGEMAEVFEGFNGELACQFHLSKTRRVVQRHERDEKCPRRPICVVVYDVEETQAREVRRGAIEERVETSVHVPWSNHHVERDKTRQESISMQSGELKIRLWCDDDIHDRRQVERSNSACVGSETIKMSCKNGLMKSLRLSIGKGFLDLSENTDIDALFFLECRQDLQQRHHLVHMAPKDIKGRLGKGLAGIQ